MPDQPSLQRGKRWRRLPWTFWPITFVMLVVVTMLAAELGIALGVSPYIAASVGGVGYALHETWRVARCQGGDR